MRAQATGSAASEQVIVLTSRVCRAEDLIRDNVVLKLDLTATPGVPRPKDQLPE